VTHCVPSFPTPQFSPAIDCPPPFVLIFPLPRPYLQTSGTQRTGKACGVRRNTDVCQWAAVFRRASHIANPRCAVLPAGVGQALGVGVPRPHARAPQVGRWVVLAYWSSRAAPCLIRLAPHTTPPRVTGVHQGPHAHGRMVAYGGGCSARQVASNISVSRVLF